MIDCYFDIHITQNKGKLFKKFYLKLKIILTYFNLYFLQESTSANTTKTESDYESAGGSEEEGGDRLRKRDEEEEGEGEEGSEDEYEDKREEGDGQEESVPAKEKKLDDDEDRRNPQYIPKKGTFYEHDDRGADDDLPADPKYVIFYFS